MTFFHEIETAEDDVKALKTRYLKRFGWESTCNTPGSYWLWKRDFADEDKKQLDWWIAHTTPEQRQRNHGPGMPSKPEPMGVITADLDLAVRMTVNALDMQTEMETGGEA